MHHTSLVIKVWDLLRNLGKIDTVLLDGIMIDSIEWLTERGVSWTLKIQWLNSTSIKVYVEELSATIQDICDLSWEDYERNVLIRDKEIIYSSSVSSKDLDDDSLYDDIIPRDWEHESIDLQDGLRQLIYFENPIVHIKPGKEYILDQFEDWDND